MQEELYKPTLTTGNIHTTKSYSIEKLFYVSFIGGTIGLTGLAVINAKMLGLSRTIISLMCLAAALVLMGKMALYYAFFHEMIELKKQYVRYIGRGMDIVLFGAFYFAMRRKYKHHLMLHGETLPILRAAILWIVLSIVAETVLVSITSR
jgi:hypothetical protein